MLYRDGEGKPSAEKSARAPLGTWVVTSVRGAEQSGQAQAQVTKDAKQHKVKVNRHSGDQHGQSCCYNFFIKKVAYLSTLATRPATGWPLGRDCSPQGQDDGGICDPR